MNSALVMNDTQPRHPNAPKRFQTAQKVIPQRSKSIPARLEGPRCAHAEQRAHHHAQVPAGGMNHITFLHLLQATKPTPSGRTRFTHVGKRPFDILASKAIQTFPSRTGYPSTIRVHRITPTHRLVRPTPNIGEVPAASAGPFVPSSFSRESLRFWTLACGHRIAPAGAQIVAVCRRAP